MAESVKYFAFLSYSHSDKRQAHWLHRKLESFRLPSKLVGKLGKLGPIPRRVYPIFRDDAELATTANLGSHLEQAMAESRFLIVLCSPAAAKSKWVNEEIRFFKSLGRADRILCAILDGSPNAVQTELPENNDCLPPALRYECYNEHNKLAPIPFAADLRTTTKRRYGLLRLIAALTGTDFDQLYSRDRRRKQQHALAYAGIALLLMLATLGFNQWQTTYYQQQALYEKNLRLLSRAQELSLRGRQTQAVHTVLQVHAKAEHALSLQNKLESTLYQAIAGLHAPFILSDKAKSASALVYSEDRNFAIVAYRDGTLDGINIFPLQKKYSKALHKSRISKLVLLDRDAKLLTAGFDGTINLIETDTSRIVKRLAAHDGAITDMVMSPDGLSVATGATDNRIRIWELPSLDLKHNLTGYQASLRQLEFSADGRYLLGLDYLGYLRVWETQSYQLHQQFYVPNSLILSAQFGPGSRKILTAHNTGVYQWDIKTGKSDFHLGHHASWVSQVQYSPHGTHFITVSWDSTACVWRSNTARLEYCLQNPQGIKYAAYTGHDNEIISVSKDNTVELWHADTGQRVHQYKLIPSELAMASKDRSARFIFTYSDFIQVYPLLPYRILARLEHGHSPVSAIQADDRLQRLITTDMHGLIRIWSLESFRLLDMLKPHTAPIRSASLDVTHQQLLTGTQLGSVHFWDLQQLKLKTITSAHHLRINAVDFNHDGSFALSAGDDRVALLYDTNTGNVIHSLDLPRDILDARFSPNGEFILINMGDIQLFRLQQQNAYWLYPNHTARVNHAEFSADTEWLLTASNDHSVQISDIKQRRTLLTLNDHSGPVHEAHFSADAGHIITASQDGLALVYSLQDVSKPVHLVHDGPVYRCALSPDNTLAVTVTEDHHIHLWNAATGNHLGEYVGHSSQINSLTFSDNGHRLITADSNGLVYVWRLLPVGLALRNYAIQLLNQP